jgi:hypothetical protein
MITPCWLSANDFYILTDRPILLVVDRIPPETTESQAWGGQKYITTAQATKRKVTNQ